MSQLSWLDYSEQERQQVMQVIDLFRDEETRDELGLGAFRDTLADRLFPGTSTIQTRLRYFLFIPWVMKYMEERHTPSRKAVRRNRQLQSRLRDALTTQEAGDGIIGAAAGYRVQRLPSNIYWNGLALWGIRLFPGSESAYFESLDGYYERQRTNRVSPDGEPDKETLPDNWHPALPTQPEQLFDKADFTLTDEEAAFLLDRIRRMQPDCLLREWMDRGVTADNNVRFPWHHPAASDLPADRLRELHHARNFSERMHGAALLYNLMLSEQKSWEERINHYRKELAQWWDLMQERSQTFASWNLENFWELLRNSGGRISPHAVSFVQNWHDLVKQAPRLETLTEEPRARELITTRERRMKGKRTRIDNPRMLELWSGISGAAQLNYRWNIPVKTYLDDMAAAQQNIHSHV